MRGLTTLCVCECICFEINGIGIVNECLSACISGISSANANIKQYAWKLNIKEFRSLQMTHSYIFRFLCGSRFHLKELLHRMFGTTSSMLGHPAVLCSSKVEKPSIERFKFHHLFECVQEPETFRLQCSVIVIAHSCIEVRVYSDTANASSRLPSNENFVNFKMFFFYIVA